MGELSASLFLTRSPIFTTREFALLCGRRPDAASRSLTRLANAGSIVRVTRGVWAQPAHPYFNPLAAVSHLLGGERGYVSFLTAMHLHGMLSQIPSAIQIATTGHTRGLRSPIGHYQFIQLKPAMMTDGIELQPGNATFPIATPEKALLDTLYVATRRGRRFARLPELELDALRATEFKRMLDRLVTAPAAHSAICTRLAQLAPGLVRDFRVS